MRDTPRRCGGPCYECLGRPGVRFARVAGGALAAGRVGGVVCVLFDRSLEAGWVLLVVAAKAEGVAGDGEVRDGVGVDLVTVEAAELAVVHVALLEAAAVDEGDFAEREGADRVGVGEVAEDGFEVLCRVADDVGHARLLPAFVGFQVTEFAGFGAGKARSLNLGQESRRQKMQGEEGRDHDA